MTTGQELKVTTHVGRDLLASAASFKTEAAAVWEYVVNSLQYVDPGISPRVQVQVKPQKKEIYISDNGRGMTAADLSHFFTMHAENPDRLAGRTGRGKFGTGKSAAFGIANKLVVDTVRSGKRNVALLTREMIENTRGEEIEIQWIVREQKTDQPNGTTIEISDIILKNIKRAPIIDYVERHMQAWRASSPQVAIDTHVCEYREPEIDDEFLFQPSALQEKTIGALNLTIKVARAPLPPAEQGIAITAGLGNLVAIECAGIEGKEYGNYLFGEVDVPALERSDSPIEPYDPTRSLQLNPQHPVVAVLLGFIGSKLEEVRKGLVRRAQEARKSEEARRLAREANRIAEILNEDFRKVVERLQEIRAAASRSGAAEAHFGARRTADAIETYVKGFEERGVIAQTIGQRGMNEGKDRPPPDLAAVGSADPTGKDLVDPVGGDGGKRRRPKGGFRVEYKNLGRNEERSVYDPTTLTILINLDHPLVAAALGQGSVEDPTFRRLSYEIAFSEYAMGLGYEISRQDPNIPADDLLYEVRSTLNRVSTAAVALYR